MAENKALKDHLNVAVATQGMLFTKLHQYHWYVKGKHFFTLHEIFEKYYDQINEYFDEFAERLLTIEGRPYSTLQEFIEHSIIKEKPYTSEISQSEMVQSVIDDFKKIVEHASEGIELAGEANDPVTEDLYIGYKTDLEKHIWMLKAYLDK
ncbi:MAG: DNA starvation/stationary phase protection protein [Amphibacillus sp.]|nr:DNA starvation/stationary phase protection protein [Amphibacillus sp.]